VDVKKTLVVIGGGAAGFFCAVNAARLNTRLRVILVEKTGKLLSKVKVSGGGRCNVTHACFSVSEMIKKYPRGSNFLKKSYQSYFTTHTIHWFEERGVKLVGENDGRMFPESNSSQTIIDCLLREADWFRVEILLKAEVRAINRVNDIFRIFMADDRELDADYVCVACGGYPKSSMFEWLTRLGHTIEHPLPSLFTFNMPGDPISALMGISIEEVTVKIAGTKLSQTGPVLITHWGLSGPGYPETKCMGSERICRL
jgi:predicted Rossmann fold flavoprotein